MGRHVGPDAWWIPYYVAVLTAEVCFIAWLMVQHLSP